VDAITGEGLCLAFRQAMALAEAIECGDLARYQRRHSQIARRPEWMARLLLALGDHVQFRRAAMCAMTSHSAIFEKMLAVHVDAFQEISSAAWRGDDAQPDPSQDARRVYGR
jgi:flavin-dependent dehydrogenase